MVAKEVLFKKEEQQNQFNWHMAHSYCPFASLHVRHNVLIVDGKILPSLLNS